MSSEELLPAIERQLAGAAELHLTGVMNAELYISAVRGALVMLPLLEAPRHIPVLKCLKVWKENELIPSEAFEQLSSHVLAAASRGPTAGPGSSGSQSISEQPSAPVMKAKAKAAEAAPAPPAKKTKTAPVQTTTLFSVLPGAAKTLVKASELRAQREASFRGEDYEIEQLGMRCFPTEQQSRAAPAVVKEYSCPKCPRAFTTQIGLANHTTWAHSADTKPKQFFEPQPEVLPTPVEVNFAVDTDGILSVGFTLDGLTLEEVRAEEAAARAAQAEREAARGVERKRRERIREAEEEAEKGVHRRGSAHRHQYTAKEKLRILEIFDKIRADKTILRKVDTFESDLRVKGCPYTTVRVGWDPPKARAKISAAAGKEHAGTLLRIDTKSRKVGKFAAMETELFARFKARRARGRKVSGRWLTAMGRQLMLALHPDQATSFKGGKSWRRRFALRFKIGLRRKTNAKNKTWADTEPILLRYFKTLRRRLQWRTMRLWPRCTAMRRLRLMTSTRSSRRTTGARWWRSRSTLRTTAKMAIRW